ncbi:beta-lactamase/transpeptidase-like protein [Triangularia verruculosa]|uniref:Beta-lactamase/transpeptidase-like protein n=1 Tax=Triangularia verruculosa TaxID=2587418 RepID=A0AAN6XN39_9PEZI|nr:beta-lactamase/transpeptidase-like protein [Triangularia verruculosa]
MATLSSSATVDGARARLLSIRPELEKMMAVAGTVGLSYGVVLHGELVLIDNLGYRDLERKLPPDEETIFPICSMAKGLVSSLVGMLVEEGKLDFDDRVADLLSWYNPKTTPLKESARLSDWMSMQSGTEPYQVWFQSQNNIIFKKEDAMKIINNLESVTDLRTSFSRIFEPLNLDRTDAKGAIDGVDNVAKAYTVLNNGTPINIRRTPISGATILGAGGGVHSCIKDLLVLYREILRASVDQFKTGTTSTTSTGSVFQRLTTTMSAHSKLPGPSFHESTYGMGWLQTHPPNQT